ncbi:MAG: glycosyltransferase family 4 protein, partial [Blastocatellia bacterium]
ELFNSVMSLNKVDLEIIYLRKTCNSRHWTDSSLSHKAVFLDSESSSINDVRASVLASDLTIFNYYADRTANNLLNLRAVSGKPWVFWGERPGFRKPEWLGRLRRKIRLAQLHASQAPIWGIGQFAVDQYRSEFGSRHAYYNIPYFSDLERFQSIARKSNHVGSERVFLFSGSLIHRKGVDLLARAFVRLAREVSNVRLKLMGTGELHNSLIKTLQPVKDRVEFLGFKDWSELPACYAEADVLCVPSRYDGWGLVVPEGLAAGLPVVGTDQMGAAIEFVKTGCNGWLLPAGDEDALFAALREAALLLPDKLAQRSCYARESINEHSLRQGAGRFITAANDVITTWKGGD